MEDPSFRVRTDEETGQTIIAGMGELHLEIIVDRLLREFKVEANVGKPQVAYRETITQAAEAEGKYIRQTGGRGQYGHVLAAGLPNEPGKGFVVREQDRRRRRSPASSSRRSSRAFAEAMSPGVLAGYPMVDVKVELFDGSFHDVDSNEMAFKIAGSMAFKDACNKAGAGAARADHELRGGDARGLHGRRDRRPQRPAREDPRHERPATGRR